MGVVARAAPLTQSTNPSAITSDPDLLRAMRPGARLVGSRPPPATEGVYAAAQAEGGQAGDENLIVIMDPAGSHCRRTHAHITSCCC